MLGSMSFSSTERNRLAQLMIDLGPDAPTLCEGWTTRDLAAHLWLRENRPDAAAGMFIKPLAGRLDKLEEELKARDYTELVRGWGRGPGKFNPFRYLDAQMNLAEHFIHHEDVRRANGDSEPREFSRATNNKLHGVLKTLGVLMLRKSSRPVVLHPEGLGRIVAADKHGVADKGEDVVRVSGPVGELLLWVYGRDAAHVTVEGPVEALKRSSI